MYKLTNQTVNKPDRQHDNWKKTKSNKSKLAVVISYQKRDLVFSNKDYMQPCVARRVNTDKDTKCSS